MDSNHGTGYWMEFNRSIKISEIKLKVKIVKIVCRNVLHIFLIINFICKKSLNFQKIQFAGVDDVTVVCE